MKDTDLLMNLTEHERELIILGMGLVLAGRGLKQSAKADAMAFLRRMNEEEEKKGLGQP